MPLDLPNYTDLNSMYSGPLAARMAQDNYDQKGQLAQMLLQSQQQKNQEDATIAPLRAQFQQGQNDAQAAQLPGLKALSRSHQLTTDVSEQTHDAHIADELGKYQGLKTSRELQQITQAANAYGQVGAFLGSIPGPARQAAAKQLLGTMWRPEFEQYNVQDLPDVLSTAGKWMSTAQTQYQQALGKQGAVNEGRVDAATVRSDAQVKAAQIRATQAQALQKAGQTVKEPKDFQALAVKWSTLADQETDPAMKAQYLDVAQKYLEAAKYLKPADNAKPQPNPAALGDILVAPTPRVNPLGTNQPKKPGSSADNPIVLK